MKTEQEQIDRIAKDIIYSIEDCHGNHCATCYMRERCTVKYHARKVYNAGYAVPPKTVVVIKHERE